MGAQETRMLKNADKLFHEAVSQSRDEVPKHVYALYKSSELT